MMERRGRSPSESKETPDPYLKPDSPTMIPKSPQLRLPSILLDRKPLFTDSENDTTATARSKAGYTMAVSFWMVSPPAVSFFSIHCSKPPDLQHSKASEFYGLPRVVGADGPYVLLRATFYARSGPAEYFLYTAAATPSLVPIPPPDVSDRRVRELGILGRRNEYLLADLGDAPSSESDDGYQLRIYSSRTKSWSTRRLGNPCPGVDRVIPDKVITLGQGGLLGWVDLSHGLLVCDLLYLLQHQDQDPPVPGAVRYIPLPPLLPGNRDKLIYPIPPTQKMETNPSADKQSHSASWFRDLTCVNGVLKFVETENPGPPENTDNIVYDSDSIMLRKHKAVDGNPKQHLLPFTDAWRAVTWTRMVYSSSNFWRQTSSAPFAHIRRNTGLMDKYSAFPIISPDGDGGNISLYLKSAKESCRDGWGWVADLDIVNMELTEISKYYLPNDFYKHPAYDQEHPFSACTLSRHLNLTEGNNVSVCYKITQDSSSANHPSETSTHVGSCEPRITIKRPSESAGKIKRPRIAVIQDDHISEVHPIQNNLAQRHKWDAHPGNSMWPHQNNLTHVGSCEPRITIKRPSESAGKIKRPRIAVIQDDHISEVHPIQNNLAQRHKWDAHPGNSMWPHRNNLPLPWVLNNLNGPCRPGYPSLGPVHGGHNSQPLSLPSKHQLTSSSELKPHEAPQPCFSYSNVASYHGYSQQLSAPDSFAYGAHTSYGNYQQQWQQLSPTLELHNCASWQHPPPLVQCQPAPLE